MKKGGTMDKIVKICGSVVQLGELNSRIYLMKLNQNKVDELLPKLDDICIKNKYTKIFAKVPSRLKEEFENAGYRGEAFIKEYFLDDDVLFMSKYFSDDRKTSKYPEKVREVIDVAKSKKPVESIKSPKLDDSFSLNIACKDDAEELANLYKEVFETYPFPIYDPKYILETMDSHVIYFIIKHSGKIVAASSSEIDKENRCVEMTDFAVLPEYQGYGLAQNLLFAMEDEMRKNGIRVAYTIARALSFGMNITFAKLGYEHTGTLVNNTNICGKLEDMNVWYKPLK